MAEFEAEEAPAALQHAIGLGQRLVDLRHVPDAEGDGVAVEMVVGQAELLGIALDEADAIIIREALVGALAPDAQHVGIDVEHGDVGLRATGLQHREGDIARAAGHVEMMERPVLGRVDRGQERALPGPVQAARHQVVHQVVAVGDLVEDVVDLGLLLGELHRLEAEMGGVGSCCHGRAGLVQICLVFARADQ